MPATATKFLNSKSLRFINMACLSLFISISASMFYFDRFDFNTYYAGGIAERHSTFDNGSLVQNTMKKLGLETNSDQAPYPYGSVILIAVVFVPLSFLPYTFASWLFFATAIGLLILAIARINRKFIGPLTLVALFSFPETKAMFLGNWSLITGALILHAIIDAKKGKTERSALLITLAALFKIYPAFLLLAFVVKKQWRALSYAAALAAVMTIISCLFIGLHDFVHGVSATLNSTKDVGVKFLNMSIAGVFSNFANSGHQLVIISLIVLGISTASIIAMRKRPLFELCAIASLFGLLIGPLSWDHYFLLVIPVAILLDMGKLTQKHTYLIGILLFVAWFPWEFVNVLPGYLKYETGGSALYKVMAIRPLILCVIVLIAALKRASRIDPEATRTLPAK